MISFELLSYFILDLINKLVITKKIAEEIILTSLKVVNMAENINHKNQNKVELLKLMHTLY